MGIVEEDIARVRDGTDIVEVVSQHTQLRKVGQRWVGLCPFHSEKTPSFSVNQQEGFYHCFGCKASGDVITFVREIEQLDFVEAMESLAGRIGVSLRYTEKGVGEDRKRRHGLQERLEAAVGWYHSRLRSSPDAAAARKYLRGRGFDSDEVAHYRLGWAPRGWDELTRALKLSRDDLEATGLGLLNRRGRLQDFFRGRVMFPIFDERGRPIGFGARKLPGDDGPKYQNSRDGDLYHKSRALYGLNWAKAEIVREGEVVVCEGYTDVIGFARAGMSRAVATCGTALTEDHVKVLSRFTRRIVLAYDADEAGRSAAERVYEWEKGHGVEFRVVELPAGSDPDELSREDPGRLAELVAGARPYLEFRLQRILDSAELDSAEGRARAADDALGVIAAHPDPLVVDQYLMDLAERTHIEADRLRERLPSLRAGRNRDSGGGSRPRDAEARPGSPEWYDETPPPGGRPRPGIPEGAEREALRMVLQDPASISSLHESFFSDPSAREVFQLLRDEGDVKAAAALAPPELSTELARLAVEDLPSDPYEVLSQLAVGLVRESLAELEREARGAEDPFDFTEQIQFLAISLEDVREMRLEPIALAELLAWLRQWREQK